MFSIGLVDHKFDSNVGQLLRSAHIFGAESVHITRSYRPHATDTPKAYKEKLHRFPDEDHFIQGMENLKRFFGFKVVGIELTDTAVPLSQFEHPEKCFYILGNESFGLSPQALEVCDSVVVIETKENISLNVATAGAIVMSDRFRRTL